MSAGAKKLDWSKPVRMTEQEYLAFEAESEEKHEYYDGIVRPLSLIIMMAGGALEHGQIIANLHRFLGNRLEGSACRTLDSSVRVRPKRSARYAYPDVTVYCGKPEYDEQRDRRRTTLLNPVALIEVLSPGTAKFDRTTKFDFLAQSLREYVLVEQDEPYVQTIWRDEQGQWVLRSWRREDGKVQLSSLGVELPFEELYRDVAFPDPAKDENYVITPAFPEDRDAP